MIRYSDINTQTPAAGDPEPTDTTCTSTLLHTHTMDTIEPQSSPQTPPHLPQTPHLLLASSSDSESTEPDQMCRICRCAEGAEPLISPCYCSGTLQYVHQTCLMKWLKANDRINKHHCELCQYEFSLKPKPWVEWQMPALSVNEQRRATCLIVICILAVLIVIWSINDLVQNIHLVQKIHLNWGFWTKLLFIAFGLVILGFQYPTFKYFFVKLHDSNQIVLLNQDDAEEGTLEDGTGVKSFEN